MAMSRSKGWDLTIPAGEHSSVGRLSAPKIAFGITFAIVFAVALLEGTKPFYYDSGEYWTLGATFIKHGHFSLLNFNSLLRGYLLPLIYRGLHDAAVALGWGDSLSVKLFNALLFSLIGFVLAPRLAELAWKDRRWSTQRRMMLVALLVVFWSGYLDFPLSDFPALALALFAVVTVSRPFAAGWMLLVGAATAAVIVIRPAYELLAPIVIVLAVWGWIEQREQVTHPIRQCALCLGLLLAGFVAISLPQSLSAHRHLGTWSPVPGSASRLESAQFAEGLTLQLYGTYVGTGNTPSMLYKDEAGVRLLREERENTELREIPTLPIGGPKKYLELIFKHPLAMGGVLGRHLINALDVRYSTPYTEHLRTDWWLRVGGFLLVFLGLVRVLWPRARRSLGPARWRYLLALLICNATSLPTAVETRYLLPTFILSYILVLTPGWPNPIATDAVGLRRYRTIGVLAVALIASTILVWHVTSGASAQLQLFR
jgi:hypothetical protein